VIKENRVYERFLNPRHAFTCYVLLRDLRACALDLDT